MFPSFFVILRSERPKNLFCEAIASEYELALRWSRLLFFLVSWISFTKTSRSFHYVSTHFCFCSFGTTLPLRPTEIRWGTRYSFPSCKNIHRMFLLRQSLIEKRYLSRVRNGQGGEPCREDTFIAKVSRRKERIMGTKITNSSNIFYFIWYFWQQKYHKTARRQLRDLFW